MLSENFGMKKVEEYLVHAEQCRALAARGDVNTRQQLLKMARTWKQLAADRQAQIDRQTRLATWEALPVPRARGSE
jgi:hypothetical protein